MSLHTSTNLKPSGEVGSLQLMIQPTSLTITCSCNFGFRLFLLYADGSGTEFLSSRMVEDFLDQAYSDPSVAVLREPLPDAQGAPIGVFKIRKYLTKYLRQNKSKEKPGLYVCSR